VSYGSPPPREQSTRWAPEPGKPRRRRALAITISAALPVLVAGALVWQSAGSSARAGSSSSLLPLPSNAGGGGGGEGSGSGHGAASGGGARGQRAVKPLTGRIISIDPGHNPNNRRHPAEIARQVSIGTDKKACDTTGTSTNSGYAEAKFTLDLARRVGARLRREGAEVTYSYGGHRPWGPCVNQRAASANKADADAAISLHADGAPEGDHGFHVILPAPVRQGKADTTAITGPSRRFGHALVESFRKATGEPRANYLGEGTGLDTRADLGGLNLSRVPKVFLECGNMRDSRDARHFTDRAWRDRAARGVADGIAAFLAGERLK
jgi:N-acetylmuramoyl-L-alanine amidase